MDKKNKSKYPPETAGRLMVDKVPTISEKATIADVEKLLLQKTAGFETINYIYILGKGNKLLGVISLKEVFRSPHNTPVIKFVSSKIISVRAYTDQERVAFLALKNNLKAIPVVDKDNQFLGVVTSDDILHILDSESVENILRFGGVLYRGSYDNIFNISLIKSVKHRLPWLTLGLIGGLFAAGIVNQFEETLARNLTLAAFIPLIVYMADAVGTQMEAFIIRDLVIIPKMDFLKYFLRQLLVVLIIGFIISALLIIISLGIYGNERVSFAVGIALFFAILSSVFTGLIVPYIFGKFRLDPANASGPIATIVQDILSIFVYFTIATWLL